MWIKKYPSTRTVSGHLRSFLMQCDDMVRLGHGSPKGPVAAGIDRVAGRGVAVVAGVAFYRNRQADVRVGVQLMVGKGRAGTCSIMAGNKRQICMLLKAGRIARAFLPNGKIVRSRSD